MYPTVALQLYNIYFFIKISVNFIFFFQINFIFTNNSYIYMYEIEFGNKLYKVYIDPTPCQIYLFQCTIWKPKLL